VAGTIWFFWCRLLGRTAADLGLVMNEGAVRQLLAGLAAAGGVAVAYYGTLFLAGCASFVRLDTLTLPFLAANLGGALAMAFTEEVFFRGFILRLILPRAGAAGTVALSSLIFAASHMFRSGDLAFKAAYFAGIFLLGLVLARGALSSGSLSLPVGFHWGLIFLIILHSAVEPLAGAPHESIIIGLKGTPAAGLLLWIIFAALSLAAGKPRTGRLQTKAPR
jgi:membrane protease YdiL (CAAX protease family)